MRAPTSSHFTWPKLAILACKGSCHGHATLNARPIRTLFVVGLFALGSPGCGPSLDDKCDASGITGRDVLTKTPMTITGTLTYDTSEQLTGSSPYTLTIRYDNGGVHCESSEVVQGWLGGNSWTTQPHTTVDVRVGLATDDGNFTVVDAPGTLDEAVAGPVSLAATFDSKASFFLGAGCANESHVFHLAGEVIGSSLVLSVECPSSTFAIAELDY
jgi:hypothetical protein